MSERVFCVDFGASYTKVALRTAPQETSTLVAYPGVGRELWAPTVVAADWTGGKAKPELHYGEVAAGMKHGGKIGVFANFKRDLFAQPVVEKPGPHPLDALLGSEEFETLAARYNVLPPGIAGLRTMVATARTMLGVPTGAGPSAEAKRQDDAKKIASIYFQWLHKQVIDVCAKLPHTALNYKDIPLRIAVPVLGKGTDLEQQPGCQRLREALASTDWKLDSRLFVPEPEANAVGILTKATNALTKKRLIDFGDMFNKGPLVTVLKGDTHHPTYRALVIDIGAFTTDFAALTVDTGGKAADSSAGAGFDIQQQSIEFGITQLDAGVTGALPEDQRAALSALSPRDFAAFQVSAYTEGTGYRLPDRRVLGGGADRDAVEAGLADFTTRLTAETVAFCQQLGSASMQELILTGGGSNIPVVRDALIKAAAQVPGNPFVKTHAPGLKKTKAGPQVDNLDDKFGRGGSALGGASIYFEKSYY